jgi:phage FluMu protein Com
MPDVYVAGDQMWTTYTYGTETSSFVVLGTAILNNFVDDELLFVLAREMGHCRAGHALWQTVTRFIAGDVSVHSGLLSDGLLNALHPTRLIQGALDLPLMAWARQKEITADRAGLLAVGDEALARRVLLAWSVRSARLLQQINIEEWMKQEDASNDHMTRVSEATTSSTMYTTRRLRLLGEAARDTNLMHWSESIQPMRKKLTPATHAGGLGVGTVKAVKPPAAGPEPGGAGAGAGVSASTPAVRGGTGAGGQSAAGAAPGAASAVTADSIRVFCTKCKAGVNVPRAVLRGKTQLNVRCPRCKIVFTIRPKGTAATNAQGDGQRNELGK